MFRARQGRRGVSVTVRGSSGHQGASHKAPQMPRRRVKSKIGEVGLAVVDGFPECLAHGVQDSHIRRVDPLSKPQLGQGDTGIRGFL